MTTVKILVDNKEIESIDLYDRNHMALSENKGDLISRQAVLDGIDKYIEKAQSTGTIDDFISFAELVVKTLPSVENKGEWIVREDNTSFVKQIPRRWVECSHCGWSFSYDRIHDDFCSKCGADMRKAVSE